MGGLLRHGTLGSELQKKEMKIKPDFEPHVQCDHYDCRCMRCEELCQMGLQEEAVAIWREQRKVRCRRKPEER